MIYLFIPVLVFITVAAILNGKFLLRKKYAYDEKWYLFIPILTSSSFGLLLFYDIPLTAPSATETIFLFF